MNARSIARGPAFALAIGSAVTLAVLAQAALADLVSAQNATSVVIGDTGATVGGPTAAAALDAALHETLAAQPGVRVEGRVTRARYVITGSIIEWTRREVGDDHEVRCAVSIVVADAHGSVRAMLSGRAGARGEGDPDRLAERALLAATRSALRPLGDSLR